MYGAILGDMIGCPFEFDRGNKSTEFEMFTKDSVYTDDSVMSIVLPEALQKHIIRFLMKCLLNVRSGCQMR